MLRQPTYTAYTEDGEIYEKHLSQEEAQLLLDEYVVTYCEEEN